MEFVFTRADIGCYFDSHRGRYIGVEVILLAEEHGYDIADLRATHENLCSTNVGGTVVFESTFDEWLVNECEFYHEEWDDAENFLNGLCDNEVWAGSGECGDWGIWPCEAGEDDY